MRNRKASRAPKYTALVLAVSLWIAGGGVASATDTVINEDYYGILCGNVDDDSNNTLTVNNATVEGDVYGSNGGGEVKNNTVTLNGATVRNGDVYGSYAWGEAKNNTVTLNNATVYGSVNGGVSSSADVTGNTVTLNGATVMGGVCGGSAIQGTVKGNTVIATNSIINNLVYGGVASSGTAAGNTVTLKGTTVNNGTVFGGYAHQDGDATNNTVRLINTTINGEVFGGYKNDGDYDVVTGNTLNLLGANTVQGNVKNFQTINIRHARWGTPALRTRDAGAMTNADGGQPTINAEGIIFTNVPRVTAAMKTTLIEKAIPAAYPAYEKTVSFRFGTTLKGTGTVKKNENDLIFEVNTKPDGTPDVEVQEETHNALMGAGAGMATLSAGNDFIGAATEGLSQAANVGADGVASYAQMGGGSIRQETGSHIDVKSWNAVLALGRKNEKPRGTFEYGAFFEYGRGNYTTYNGDLRGDGFTYYTGKRGA